MRATRSSSLMLHMFAALLSALIAGCAASESVTASSIESEPDVEDPLYLLLMQGDWISRFHATIMLAIRNPELTVPTFSKALLEEGFKAELQAEILSKGGSTSAVHVIYHATCVTEATRAARLDNPKLQEVLVQYYYGSLVHAGSLTDEAQILMALGKLHDVEGALQQHSVREIRFLEDKTLCRALSSTAGGRYETGLRVFLVKEVRVWLPIEFRVLAVR